MPDTPADQPGAMAGTWEDAVRWLIGQPDQRALVEACYYDAPLAAAATRYRDGPEWQAVRALLPPPPGRALDLGAGNGIASFALASDGWRVTAIEPDPSALVGAAAIRGLAAGHGLAIDVVEEWGESLPLADASVDVVFARQVLHHARDLPQLCRELHRVLVPGGRLVAVRDHVVSRAADLPAFFAKHPLHALYGGENAFTMAAYRAALTGAGLRIDRVLRAFDSPINLAPATRTDVIDAAAGRAARLGVPRPVTRGVLGGVFGPAAAIASRLDNRPGRLVSFVCTRPG